MPQKLRTRLWEVVIATNTTTTGEYVDAVRIATDETQSSRDLSGGLHFSFEIERDLEPEPNKCSISVMNLPETVRASLDGISLYDPKRVKKKKSGPRNRDAEAKGLGKRSSSSATRAPKPGKIRCEVYAGYAETGKSLLFRGDLRLASSELQDDGTWRTRIQGEDGGSNVRHSRISESFGPGTPHIVVARACASALGLGQGNLADFASDLRQSYPRGTVLSGSAAGELTGLLRRAGLTYSIQNSALVVRARGAAAPDNAVLLNAASGLVGAPVRDNTGVVQARCLLNNRIVIGSYVRLDSPPFTGDYEVRRVKYRGSNYENEFYCDMELKSFQAEVASRRLDVNVGDVKLAPLDVDVGDVSFDTITPV